MLSRRLPVEEPRPLGHEGHAPAPLVRCEGGKRRAVHENRPVVGLEKPEEEPGRRRLPRAARAQESHGGPGGDREREAVERGSAGRDRTRSSHPRSGSRGGARRAMGRAPRVSGRPGRRARRAALPRPEPPRCAPRPPSPPSPRGRRRRARAGDGRTRGGENEDEEGLAEREPPGDEARPHLDRDHRRPERREGLEHQGGDEGEAQDAQGHRAVPLARPGDCAHLVVRPPEGPQGRQALEGVQEARGQPRERHPLPTGLLPSRLADEPL